MYDVSDSNRRPTVVELMLDYFQLAWQVTETPHLTIKFFSVVFLCWLAEWLVVYLTPLKDVMFKKKVTARRCSFFRLRSGEKTGDEGQAAVCFHRAHAVNH